MPKIAEPVTGGLLLMSCQRLIKRQGRLSAITSLRRHPIRLARALLPALALRADRPALWRRRQLPHTHRQLSTAQHTAYSLAPACGDQPCHSEALRSRPDCRQQASVTGSARRLPQTTAAPRTQQFTAAAAVTPPRVSPGADSCQNHSRRHGHRRQLAVDRAQGDRVTPGRRVQSGG